MNVKDALSQRRAYRSLKPVEITLEMIRDLAGSASLAPSCFNKQPWRFVFVFNPEVLKELSAGISEGNSWTKASSMIVAVCTDEALDCMMEQRAYALFDTGMASAFLILRATELGLVAHPIAGYSEVKCKEVLKIPQAMRLITLVCIGKKSSSKSPDLSSKMMKLEKNRPPRLPLDTFTYLNHFSQTG